MDAKGVTDRDTDLAAQDVQWDTLGDGGSLQGA